MTALLPRKFHLLRWVNLVGLRGQVPVRWLYVEHQREVEKCYHILKVPPDCDDSELRDAYLSLAKRFHPDSDSKQADQVKFAQVENAYRSLMRYRSKAPEKNDDADKLAEARLGIEHTAPQHRQYLSFEGRGYGTPSQRQKQYSAFRAERAQENVHDYRVRRISAKYETQLVFQDKTEAKKQKIRNAMERLVEDLIQEAMARGDFKNLPGEGKPLKTSSDHNPMIDSTTHNLNKMLIQNGCAPEWIMLEREIKQDLSDARRNLLQGRISVGEELSTAVKQLQWQKHKDVFQEKIQNINKKVFNYNLSTPILRSQIVPYKPEKLIDKVLKNYDDLRSRGELPDRTSKTHTFVTPVTYSPDERISMKVVWKELKALFNS